MRDIAHFARPLVPSHFFHPDEWKENQHSVAKSGQYETTNSTMCTRGDGCGCGCLLLLLLFCRCIIAPPMFFWILLKKLFKVAGGLNCIAL
jgi:hypothetical protein